jgi:hypothetical protein
MCFASDSSAIAIFEWKHQDPLPGDFSIRVFDLPSGMERNRISLTQRDWHIFRGWDGQHLTAFAHVPDPNEREIIRKVFAIDLKSNPIGQETERPELERRYTSDENVRYETNWYELKTGMGWRAEIHEGGDVQFDWLWRYWNKCAEWIGAKGVDESATPIRLRFLDLDTNRIRYQSPLFVNSTFRLTDSTFRIAGNGSCYTVENYQIGELSLWNAKSIIRWPWALAASLGTLLLILLLGRWRTKRLQVTASLSK